MGRSAAEIGELRLSRELEAFTLRYVEKLKYREIGEKIGRIDGTGAVSVERARQLVFRGGRYLASWRRKHHPLHVKAKIEMNKIRDKSENSLRNKAARAAYAEEHKHELWFQEAMARQERWHKEQMVVSDV